MPSLHRIKVKQFGVNGSKIMVLNAKHPGEPYDGLCNAIELWKEVLEEHDQKLERWQRLEWAVCMVNSNDKHYLQLCTYLLELKTVFESKREQSTPAAFWAEGTLWWPR
jgi:hypothetical protein